MARRLFAKALERKASDAKWLVELTRWDEAALVFESLEAMAGMDRRQHRSRRAELDDHSHPRRERVRT
jgi:hypothetical protein